MSTLTKEPTTAALTLPTQVATSDIKPAVGVDVIVTLEDGTEVTGFYGVDGEWWHATEYYTLEYKSWRPIS